MVLNNPDNSRVALLLPAYNCQADLNATIAALPVEEPLFVLIVDDGSTPPLVEPACDAAHQICILRNQRNRGIHGALRRGIQVLHKQGFAYAARLDAGDFALPMRFRLQKDFLDAHPDVAVVGSAFELVDEQGGLLCTAHMPTEDAALRRFKLLKLGLSHPAVMLRVAAVVDVGNYGDGYPCAEDLDLFLRLMQRYAVANLPEVLTRKVEYAKSITVRRRRRMIVSTIRLQFRDLRVSCWADWAGLAKSISQLLVPRSLFEQAKLSYVRKAAAVRQPQPSVHGG
jgi:glycosyltransferase involved in cell wall biosynthesis